MNHQRDLTFLRPLFPALFLVILFLGRLIFTNLILARGDMFLYFYPYWQAARDALLQGRLPLWNPDIFMGAPLLANSQVGFFYPMNWPLWLFWEVPFAVKAAIVAHLALALAGVYFLARRLELSRPAAWLAAALFALGGYLTAQSEHINQLQGLAWLPWVLWAGSFQVTGRRGLGRQGALVGLFLGLQFLAGHTQTVFISAVALLLWLVGFTFSRRSGSPGTGAAAVLRSLLRPAALLVIAGVLALMVAAIQIMPTFELAALSSRAGGLVANDVLSFSWHPLLVPRSLLPPFGQGLFTEYVAWLPLTALYLALVSIFYRRRAGLAAPLLLTGAGLFLALGRFNGIYFLLARLPGFDLFRVPARWLVLYALGVALLAGFGLDALFERREKWAEDRAPRRSIRPFLPALPIFLLVSGQFVAVWLGRWLPVGPEAPLELPSRATLLLQAGEMAVLALLLLGPGGKGRGQGRLWAVTALALLVLYGATRTLPVNNLTTPEAYFDRRPSSLRLQAETVGMVPPDRFLSLSEIFFDPGDWPEIETIYRDLLPLQARYDYAIAIKLKEVISPNLSMVYRLPAVDGFDGGILPLDSYSQIMAGSILAGEVTVDGRLREYLSGIPAAEQLALFNIGYIITDKVGDIWVDGVFYDRQRPVSLAAGEKEAVAFVPEMAATELRLLSEQAGGRVEVVLADGSRALLTPVPTGEGVLRAELPRRAALAEVTLVAAENGEPWEIQALTLVDRQEGSFYPLVAGPFRLIYSGDVKIYRFLAPLPRAVVIDPQVERVQDGLDGRGTAEILTYKPERVELRASLDRPGRLVLLDAYYPGWQASLAGEPLPIVPVERFFRGIDLPAGEHEIVMAYRPPLLTLGLVLTLIGLSLVVGLLLWSRRG